MLSARPPSPYKSAVMPDWLLESMGAGPVAGVDEVGRGPLAGPVVAAAVILDRARLPADLMAIIDDSKTLSPAKRLVIAERLPAFARIGLGRATRGEIDRLNILRASLLAMRRAIRALDPPPARALIDGRHVPDDLPCPAEAIIGGDRRSLSIAAASIVAKVTRDRLMARLARRYPGYGWERNAGYGTAEHLDALARLGVSPQHRRSFRPVLNILRGSGAGTHHLEGSAGLTG